MIHTLFLGILVLDAPKFAEVRRGKSLHCIDVTEDGTKIQTGILRDETDVGALTAAETFGDGFHSETVILSAPIVALHLPTATLDDELVLLFFCGCAFGCAFVLANLRIEFLILFLPRSDALKDIAVVGQLSWNFRPLHITIEPALAKGEVFHRAVAAYTLRYGVLNIVFRISTNKLRYADCVSRV